MAKDFLSEMVAKRTAHNPEFARLVKEAAHRRQLARRLAALREARRLSQTLVAARMGTSASVVSKLESGADVKLSTLQRYYAAHVDQRTNYAPVWDTVLTVQHEVPAGATLLADPGIMTRVDGETRRHRVHGSDNRRP